MRHQVTLALAALLAGGSAGAEVPATSEAGFVSHNEVLVAASPQESWDALVRPGDWWNGEHTYSGDAANMSIAPIAGGCFCETIPGPGGEIEHMRVIYVAPGSTLRLTGGLGPLQAEAVTGVLTMTLEPDGEMTRISWDYVVGGYMRMPMAELAPLVDQVVGEQLLRLATRLGTVMDPASPRGR
ncbi:MAG TPA: ATPase [Croceibacterium sp.]|nr:ATPase [Croceibacterium sp.]